MMAIAATLAFLAFVFVILYLDSRQQKKQSH